MKSPWILLGPVVLLLSTSHAVSGQTAGNPSPDGPIPFSDSDWDYWSNPPHLSSLGSGNVGIGTMDPGAMLEVSGDLMLRLPTVAGSNRSLFFSDGTGGNGDGNQVASLNARIAQTQPVLQGVLELRVNVGDNSTTVMLLEADGVGGARVSSGPLTVSDLFTVNGTTNTTSLNITGGSDLAEPFEILEAGGVEPGMVVSIDRENPGKLRMADEAYDPAVLGVISGAGGIEAGMTMSQGESLDGTHPVALAGRVYCWCDAGFGSVRPGDLLTSSPTPGYAMKVTDRGLAVGSVIGKALTPLTDGRGLVMMVVAIQ